MSKLLTIVLIAIGGLALAACKPREPSQAVVPKEAQSLGPISLGALIYAALPRDQLQWDTLQIPEVRWITSGIANYAVGDGASREGWARVRVNDTVSQLLRQNWVEVAWHIELESDELAKWGPETLTIKPCTLSGSATEEKGCLFPPTAINDPRMVVKLVCEAGPASPHYSVFQVRSEDGRGGTVSHVSDGGSGGVLNHIEVSSQPPKEICADIEREYPS